MSPSVPSRSERNSVPNSDEWGPVQVFVIHPSDPGLRSDAVTHSQKSRRRRIATPRVRAASTTAPLPSRSICPETRKGWAAATRRRRLSTSSSSLASSRIQHRTADTLHSRRRWRRRRCCCGCGREGPPSVLLVSLPLLPPPSDGGSGGGTRVIMIVPTTQWGREVEGGRLRTRDYSGRQRRRRL